MKMKVTNVFRRLRAVYDGEIKPRMIVLLGGSRCFSGEQKIETPQGLKKISDINKDDLVFTYKNGKKVSRRVLNTFKMKNTKPTVRIKLKNGKTITCSDDHKFRYNDEWVEIKDILKLHKNGN